MFPNSAIKFDFFQNQSTFKIQSLVFCSFRANARPAQLETLFFGRKTTKMSTIALEGMEFYSYHGYYHEERKYGGYYIIDVYLQVELSTDWEDELESTVNYEQVYEMCEEVMKESTRLIETVGLKINSKVKAAFPTVNAVKTRVSKLNPPLAGKVARTFVEIES